MCVKNPELNKSKCPVSKFDLNVKKEFSELVSFVSQIKLREDKVMVRKLIIIACMELSFCTNQ